MWKDSYSYRAQGKFEPTLICCRLLPACTCSNMTQQQTILTVCLTKLFVRCFSMIIITINSLNIMMIVMINSLKEKSQNHSMIMKIHIFIQMCILMMHFCSLVFSQCMLHVLAACDLCSFVKLSLGSGFG